MYVYVCVCVCMCVGGGGSYVLCVWFQGFERKDSSEVEQSVSARHLCSVIPLVELVKCMIFYVFEKLKNKVKKKINNLND